MLTGLRNTLTVAVVGIVLTLILGHPARHRPAVGQLAGATAAGAYVEVVRNVPPLLVIIFVNSVALATLPPIEEADEYGGLLVVSVAEFGVVAPRADGNVWAYVALLLVAVVDRRGARPVAGPCRGAHRARRPAAGCGRAACWRSPSSAATWRWTPRSCCRTPRSRASASRAAARMGLPFVATLVGLVLYTSSHVAEIVRGSILAVPKGQTEAAGAIGLSSGQRLRHVVLPQAFRIATPPDHQPVPQPHEEHVARASPWPSPRSWA